MDKSIWSQYEEIVLYLLLICFSWEQQFPFPVVKENQQMLVAST